MDVSREGRISPNDPDLRAVRGRARQLWKEASRLAPLMAADREEVTQTALALCFVSILNVASAEVADAMAGLSSTMAGVIFDLNRSHREGHLEDVGNALRMVLTEMDRRRANGFRPEGRGQ